MTILNNMVTPYTNRLYVELQALGADLDVVSCTGSEPNRDWPAPDRPTYRHSVLPGITVRLAENRFAHLNAGVIRHLSRTKPTILVINGFYPTMLIAAVWAIFRQVPLILTVDGWARDMPTSIYHHFARRLILSRAAAVVTCGDKGHDYFVSQGVPEERILVCPLVPAWSAQGPIVPLEARQFEVLWVAHVNNTVKNATFVGELAIALKARMAKLKVRFVGRGPALSDLLHRLDDAGVNYTHSATVPWNEMEMVYSQAKILVLPSLQEPWGLVCNEAMQTGTPCVVSEYVGAANDLVIDGVNGLVLPLEVGSWVESICRLMTNSPELERQQTEAVKFAGMRSIERSARLWHELLKSVKASIDAA
ncbi:glycosyltransferase family 4 protein [Brevundimonas sp. TWP2-3-4b1]|uniref:glycosyltransferase family 4 protein n=1 Tax=Brevundimonas sp. TWP2-3-4b1 TaxID=2804580 RepID=UPI003CEBBC42